MRAKLDENLPVEAAELLRTAGWECDTVYDEGLAGADDPKVAAACQADARVLFTLDLDFADIRVYPPSEYVGRRQDRVVGDSLTVMNALASCQYSANASSG